MTTVGYATLGIIPEVKGLARNIDRQTSGDLAAAGRKGGKRFGDEAGREASSSFKSRVSSGLKGFNPLGGLAIGAAGVALFATAISGASDLAESTSKANVVFGEASESVLKFGKDASSSIGQSEAQALSATGTFGNLLRSVGLTEEASAKLSTSMVSLGSDLASFNNTSIDDALEALRSGLVGETEPLKRFGVNMNEAVLKAKALELGLSDGKSVLDSNAKAQAAYAVIMEQTTLAQGDFARTAGGLANQQKTLAAQWSEMTTSLGQELLPATTAFVSFLNDKGLPALSATGGVVKDTVQAIAGLPAPVLAAAAAFGVLRLASTTGLGSTAAASVASMGSAMDSLRIRTMLGQDAYLKAGKASIVMSGQAHVASMGVGRLKASLIGVQAASAGAGASLKSGLGKASALVGGPWGAAFIGGTVILTKFWQNQQESKARVEELTAALDQQTGKITEAAEQAAFKNLQDSGAIDIAKKLGISLDLVRDAALGDADAISQVNEELSRQQAAFTASTPAVKGASDASARFSIDVTRLREALGDSNTELAAARDGIKDFAEFSDEGSKATDRAADAFVNYRTEIRGARTELQKLIDKEQERTLAAIQNQRDELALITTMQATRKEAREGARTLDINTKAGQENKAALLDLADQWASSTPKARRAIGGYEEMRKQFVKVADSMGITTDQAENLADKLLLVPKTAPLKFQSEGYKELMAQIRSIKFEAQRFTLGFTSQAANQRSSLDDRRFAHGGKVGGRGMGDNQLIWADPREWVINPRASAYYGDGLMNAINQMQIPRFAEGGRVAPAPVRETAGSSGNHFHIGQVVTQDVDSFLRRADERSRAAQSDGVRMR